MLFEMELRMYSQRPIGASHVTFGDPDVEEPNWGKPVYYDGLRRVFHPHTHKELEVHQVKKGQLLVEIYEKPYALNPGDILIINPYELHQGLIPSNSVTSYTYTTLDPGHFAGWCGVAGETIHRIKIGELRFPTLIRADQPASAIIGTNLDEILIAYQNAISGGIGEDCILASAATHLLGILLQQVPLYPSDENVKRSVHFMYTVQHYVEQRYQQNLTTELIAAELGYNKCYFCTLFKQNFRMTFVQYLNMRRIQYAMTCYRDCPLIEIAEKVGFSDYGYFARVFKKYTDMTPRDFFQ